MTDEHEPRPKLGNTEILLGDSAKSIGPETDEDRLKDDHDYQGSLAETAQKPEKRGWSLKTKIGAGAAAAAILLGVGGLAERQITKKSNSVATDPVPTNTSPSASAVAPAETTTPSPETSASPIEMQSETFEQQTSVEAMDAMSIEEFAQLPYADRAAYTYSKSPNSNFFATPDEVFDPTTIPGFNWQGMMVDALGDKDPTQGAKAVSALNYYTTENDGSIAKEYQDVVDSIVKAGGSNYMDSTLVYVDNGVTQSGTDREGSPVVYTNITYQPEAMDSDEKIGPELTVQVIEVQVKLDDGTTIMTYPQMFGVEGKKSPIKGQPY